MAPGPLRFQPVFVVVTGVCYLLRFGGVPAIPPLSRAGQVPLVVTAVAVAAMAHLGLRRSRPRSAAGAARVLRKDERRPVLYLRGFGDDSAAAVVDRLAETLLQAVLNVRTREEQLVGALRMIGPVIAVGQPEERLPRLGAARLSLSADDWQSGVSELMDLCQLIVLRLAPGDGLWWEVEQVRATQPPHKLVVLVPGGRADLAARLDRHLPKPADARPEPGKWTASVIVFDEEWNPRVQGVGPPPGTGAQGTPAFYVAWAVECALERIGVHKRLTFRIGNSVLPAFGKVLLLVPAAALVIHFAHLLYDW